MQYKYMIMLYSKGVFAISKKIGKYSIIIIDKV